MRFYWLTLGVLATWRITHLVQAEDGPWAVVAKIRRLAGNSFWGQLMDCFYCLSIWVALPLAVGLGGTLGERALLWPSLSAAAILLERATGGMAAAAATVFSREDGDEPLWESHAPGGGDGDTTHREEG
jgi:hypothetical protein